MEEFVQKQESPRVLWSMLPAGEVTDEMIQQFIELGDEGARFVTQAEQQLERGEHQGAAEPPATLYHGTPASNLPSILRDGLRPGSIADANDAAQFGELQTQGELTRF